MLDREYEQHLQNHQNGDSTLLDFDKHHILWLITASTIIVPALIYINKL